MAIDFMVMPMSRYISGDFTTPMMHAAWELGVPYVVIGPDGKREFPPGLPFGGVDATERRAQILDMVLDDLRMLPAEICDNLWDERSNAEPRFHRVDAASYQALLEHFAAQPSRSFFGFRKAAKTAHCSAPLLLPCDFESPLSLTSPFERVAGATNRALQELARTKCPAAAISAAETLRQALEDSVELRLPLIVDW
jgi:hypothetical protein